MYTIVVEMDLRGGGEKKGDYYKMLISRICRRFDVASATTADCPWGVVKETHERNHKMAGA